MTRTSPSLQELALAFLRIGATSFGGPAAHLAMMQNELVERRKWLNQEEFLDLVSAANLIPGPNSTEVAIHVGRKVAGWRGMWLAGGLFILPAFLMVWAIAWFYVRFGEAPRFQAIFLGIKPVILAIIAQAIWNLSRTAIKNKGLAVLAVGALALYLSGVHELLVLLFAALIGGVGRGRFSGARPLWGTGALLCAFTMGMNRAWAQVNESQNIPVERLFGFFAKVGSVLFGSGYVLIAFLQSDLVERYHWISSQQLLDAIAVGQFTPGPVFTTATFIGYLVSGHAGAVAATGGIFAPAFLFVAVTAPILHRLRRAKWTAAILDGLNVASLSLMVGASLLLVKATAISIYGVGVFVGSLVLLTRFKVKSAWLVLGGGLMGAAGWAMI